MSPRSEHLDALRASLAKLLHVTVGDLAWAPPPWVESLRSHAAAIRARALANPRAFRRNAIVGAISLVGLVTAVQLWRHRPRAVRTAFDVVAPAATDLTVDNPQPKPLRVVFESSVAPLQAVGKVLELGVDVSPTVAGTWFIPGKSPIRVSTLHQALLIDDRTGLRVCPPYTVGPAHRVVYEMWGSDMLKLFQQAGLPRRTPPPFDPRCEARAAHAPAGPAPQIKSPLRGVVYSLRAKRLGQETITLQATSGPGVREVYWFVGRRFLGKAPLGGSLAWRPEAPGSFMVRAVDDQGRADVRAVELTVVP